MERLGARLVAASLVVVVGLAGCSPADDGSADEGSADGGSAAEAADPGSLASTVSDFVATSDGGVDVLIERDGTLRRLAVGVGSNEGESLVEGRTFRVGSISKPLVAVMVLQLVDEGAVDLDTALGAYLPDTVVGAEATIRQLLSHESGIPSYTDQPNFFPDILAAPSELVTPAGILSYVEDVPVGQVGQFAYSNTNYILLGQLIEQLDGTDLNTSLETRITAPLGLDDTFFDTGKGRRPDELVGGWSPTGGDGDPAAPYAGIASSAWAAGSLVSSTGDLALFLHALATGQLVSSDSLAEMTDFGPDGYGLGLLRVGFSATQTGFGHSGSIPGYSSTMAIDPTTGDTLVILTNNDALVADQLAAEILTNP